MTPTDRDIDLLLNTLDSVAREQPYPPQGLPIYGEVNRRETFRQLVRGWCETNAPESSR